MKVFKNLVQYLRKFKLIILSFKGAVPFSPLLSKFKTNGKNTSTNFDVGDWLSYYQRRGEYTFLLPNQEDADDKPKVSILILTYNNFHLNQLCLYSIYCNTTYPDFEVIVVDNASNDETPAWLENYAKTHSNLKVIFNSSNRGFASGNNQAVREASGEYVIFLNNDTVVTQGWIEQLLFHMQSDPDIGLIGPVTNSTGNEARISVAYTTPDGMELFAEERKRKMENQIFDIRMLAFYCVMARKDQYEKIGGLDERFLVGMFEDDDLAVRYHQSGLRVVCAEDVFIHHFQGASFGKLAEERYSQLFEENRRKYEEKWGFKWTPYNLRKE